jgi:hypothetical protein
VDSHDPFEIFEHRFAVLSLYTGREKRKGADGRDYDYFVYELKRTFVPLRAGLFNFGPATMKGVFVDGVAANGRYNGRSLVVNAPVKTVECTLPEPRPANFNGCIGTFAIHAAANARDLRVGDPLTLKLDFERLDGMGMLDDVTAPDLTTNSRLAADFSIVDKAPTGQVKGLTKSFSYVMRPKKAGASIPPVTVSSFNLANEKFEDLASNPVVLNVIDAPQLRADELVSSGPIGGGQKISGREKGVFQNITELSELDKPALNPGHYIVALLTLWLAYGLGATVLAIQRKRAVDAGWQNRQRARNEAHSNLVAARAALQAGDNNAAALGVQKSLTALIGYMSGIAPAGMTAQDASVALQKLGVSDESRQQTIQLLESIEAAKYGSIAGMQAAALVDSAETLIPRLQKEIDSRR